MRLFLLFCNRLGCVVVLGLGLKVWGFEREAGSGLGFPLVPPQFGYTTEPAFEGLEFVDPVAIASPPGETNRLFVVEQLGRIQMIPDLAAPRVETFLDIRDRVAGGVPPNEAGLLGLAFHPGYATNGHFFVFYSAITNEQLRVHLARYSVSAEDPDRADRESEALVISLQDQDWAHNAGDIHFGPDGYLYVSMGDGGGQNDALNNSQRIDKDYYSGILRIDVDRRPGSLPPNEHRAIFPDMYAIPPDNPWVGATEFLGEPVDPAQVRTEFWAVGFRNPWRMSFDPETGDLWVGDVGGAFYEEINLVVRGGNHGWAFYEGTRVGPKHRFAPQGFEQIPPVMEYPHGGGQFAGQAVIGGVVYRGIRLSQLHGAYLFADYVSGNVWAIRRDGTASTPMEFLTVHPGIAAMGRDPRNGDVLLADQFRNGIWRLTYNQETTGDPLPMLLSETGAFADLETLEPSPGVVPYTI